MTKFQKFAPSTRKELTLLKNRLNRTYGKHSYAFTMVPWESVISSIWKVKAPHGILEPSMLNQ